MFFMSKQVHLPKISLSLQKKKEENQSKERYLPFFAQKPSIVEHILWGIFYEA